MPTGLTAKIYEGEEISLREFALTCGFQVIFDHIAEQRAQPGEVAISRALLEAVAAADLRHKGQLTETIRMYQDQMQTAQHDIKPQGEA